jgi:hypothetical protein
MVSASTISTAQAANVAATRIAVFTPRILLTLDLAYPRCWHREIREVSEVQSDATTVEDYLAELPEDRRGAIAAVRAVILEHLPNGFTEGMQSGMIGYYIPLERYPHTYNGQPLAIAALANQKRHMSLYLMGIYANDDDAWWFREQWTLSGKRLDMGKSCVRFRKLDDVPLDVVGAAIARTSVDDFIADYERSRDSG